MAKRNFNGSQINQSVTIAEQAGAAIDDVRNLILKYGKRRRPERLRWIR